VTAGFIAPFSVVVMVAARPFTSTYKSNFIFGKIISSRCSYSRYSKNSSGGAAWHVYPKAKKNRDWAEFPVY
jgi:hypothetical protein